MSQLELGVHWVTETETIERHFPDSEAGPFWVTELIVTRSDESSVVISLYSRKQLASGRVPGHVAVHLTPEEWGRVAKRLQGNSGSWSSDGPIASTIIAASKEEP